MTEIVNRAGSFPGKSLSTMCPMAVLSFSASQLLGPVSSTTTPLTPICNNGCASSTFSTLCSYFFRELPTCFDLHAACARGQAYYRYIYLPSFLCGALPRALPCEQAHAEQCVSSGIKSEGLHPRFRLMARRSNFSGQHANLYHSCDVRSICTSFPWGLGLFYEYFWRLIFTSYGLDSSDSTLPFSGTSSRSSPLSLLQYLSSFARQMLNYGEICLDVRSLSRYLLYSTVSPLHYFAVHLRSVN